MLRVIKHFAPRRAGWFYRVLTEQNILEIRVVVDWISHLSFRTKGWIHGTFLVWHPEDKSNLPRNMSALSSALSLTSLPRQRCPLGLQPNSPFRDGKFRGIGQSHDFVSTDDSLRGRGADGSLQRSSVGW